MTKIKKENFSVKKEAAKLLLSLHKPIKAPKVISSSDAMLALLLHRRLNLNDSDDGCDYEVEILWTFNVGKTKMSLVHFVGYSTDFDRIIPTSKLRNLTCSKNIKINLFFPNFCILIPNILHASGAK